MNFYLVFIFVLWIVTMPMEGRGRELYFPSYYFFADRRLGNHKIKTEHVKDLAQCELLCYQHDDCVSVNIKKDLDSGTTQRECELNNSTHMEHDENLMDDNAFFYRGAKNNCGRNPHCHNGTCQSGFTDKRYRCLCKLGFTGEHCEKDNWKKVNADPVCFGARNNQYGPFEINESGLVYTFKLVHKNGFLSCNPDFPPSYWGCDNPSLGKKRLITVVTYPNKTALLLADYLRIEGSGNPKARYYSYHIAGMGINTTELVFNKLPIPLSVSRNQEFQIWYGQDLVNSSEGNNAGQTCADVYAWYA